MTISIQDRKNKKKEEKEKALAALDAEVQDRSEKREQELDAMMARADMIADNSTTMEPLSVDEIFRYMYEADLDGREFAGKRKEIEEF